MLLARYAIVHLFFTGFNCYDHRPAVACIGLPAARSCEPRQTRKGAAVAMVAGAGVRRVWVAAFKLLCTGHTPDDNCLFPVRLVITT